MLERALQNFKTKSDTAQSWVFFKLHINFPHLLGALLPYLLVPPITQSIGIGSTEVTSSEDKGWKLELQEHFASSLLKINLVQCVLVGWCDTEAIL